MNRVEEHDMNESNPPTIYRPPKSFEESAEPARKAGRTSSEEWIDLVVVYFEVGIDLVMEEVEFDQSIGRDRKQ